MSLTASITAVYCPYGCEDTGWQSERRETDQTRAVYGEGHPVWYARRCPCAPNNPKLQRDREHTAARAAGREPRR